MSVDDLVHQIATDVVSLLSAQMRLRTVCALMESEKNMTELIECVAVSQINMPQHLGASYRGDVLAQPSTGSPVIYRVDHKQICGLCQALIGRDEHAPTCARAGLSATCLN